MRKPLWALLGLALIVASFSTVPGTAATRGRPDFEARLSAGEEVQEPAVESDGRGKAVVHVDDRGHKMHIEITVDRIDEIIMAHLHLAPRGENGGIVVDLYGADPAGPEKGLLVCRTITARDLSGALAGMEISDLVDEIEKGNIYANVHTTAYPAGEIRGQLGPARRRGRR
jgi:hypothetical protein